MNVAHAHYLGRPSDIQLRQGDRHVSIASQDDDRDTIGRALGGFDRQWPRGYDDIDLVSDQVTSHFGNLFRFSWDAIIDMTWPQGLTRCKPFPLCCPRAGRYWRPACRLPSMYWFREFCNAGGLLCYGTNLSRQISRYGYFIDKILKGTKPGDIPIEEPMIFELIVNARLAKSFDLTLPTSVLISADELIE
jgi:hypothetical protein